MSKHKVINTIHAFMIKYTSGDSKNSLAPQIDTNSYVSEKFTLCIKITSKSKNHKTH